MFYLPKLNFSSKKVLTCNHLQLITNFMDNHMIHTVQQNASFYTLLINNTCWMSLLL